MIFNIFVFLLDIMDNNSQDYPPSLIPQEAPATSTNPAETHAKSEGNFFWDILETVVFALAIFIVVYLFIAQPHQVQGSSMYPNFISGEYILTNKIGYVGYHFAQPQRGDVIVFKAPAQKDFIKRVIGLPGEKFKVQNGKVYINDKELPEPYLPANLYTQEGQEFHNGEEVSIPEDHYVVLGDNRPQSSDSRDWGLITKKDIIGKSLLIYWPLNHFGLVPHARYPSL